jgi:phosphoribosylglycinamide formyltransferase-1
VDAIQKGRLNASVEVVVSNNKGALILEKAKKYNIDYFFIDHKNKTREGFDKEVSDRLKEKDVDLVLLVGFMRILSSDFVSNWEGKIMNVHPSLLPKYAGGINENVHQQVLDAKDKETGCTIHLVTAKVDGGPILVQKKCVVGPEDTVGSLKNKVQKLEGEAFIEAIEGWEKNE